MVLQRLFVAFALLCALARLSLAQERPTIRFENASGDDCVVRLVGPAGGYIDVPNSASRTVSVRGGQYHIVTRYGRPGKYSYRRGESFNVTESTYAVSRVVITLHRVANGNYDSRPASEAEFR
ncbi:MAG: hypothetical protein JSU00_25760 [Acidobacteria bacterium]|nr:hypothetical protein [Acidobacteriota bacterium]